MKLFDEKFVRFMWDDELEGKVCFAADIMSLVTLIVIRLCFLAMVLLPLYFRYWR